MVIQDPVNGIFGWASITVGTEKKLQIKGNGNDGSENNGREDRLRDHSSARTQTLHYMVGRRQ